MSGDKSKDIPKADRKEDTTSSDCLRHETFKQSGVTPAKTSAEAKSQTDRDCKAKLPQIELTNEAEAKAAKVKTIGLAALDTLGQITRESIRQEATATDSTSVLQPPNYVSGFDVNAFKDFMQTKSREERTAADHEFQAKFGKSLEDVAREQLHGDDLRAVLGVLKRQDGDVVSQNADLVNSILHDKQFGTTIEKSLRDIFAISTLADLQKMDQIYRSAHGDKTAGVERSVAEDAGGTPALPGVRPGAKPPKGQDNAFPSRTAPHGKQNEGLSGENEEQNSKLNQKPSGKHHEEQNGTHNQEQNGKRHQEPSGKKVHEHNELTKADEHNSHAQNAATDGSASKHHHKGIINIAGEKAKPETSPAEIAAQKAEIESHKAQIAKSLAAPGGLLEALQNTPAISSNTKQAIDVLKNGRDNRSDEDTLKLAAIALKAKDPGMFREAMMSASNEARTKFLNASGEDKIQSAFGDNRRQAGGAILRTPSRESMEAVEIARKGETSAALKIDSHIWHSPIGPFTMNKGGVELALAELTAEQRQLFELGRQTANPIADHDNKQNPDQQQQAKDYYNKLHTALSAAGNDTDVFKWEHQIVSASNTSIKNSAIKDETLLTKLAGHRHMILNDSVADLDKEIGSMDKTDWHYARKHPEQRNELKAMIASLGKSESDSNALLARYDRMTAADSFSIAKDAGKQSVLSTLNDARQAFGGHPKAALDALANMPKSEQELYRTDENFRKKLEGALFQTEEIPTDISYGAALPLLSTEAQQNAANRMLEQIKKGNEPKQDLAAKLAVENDPVEAVKTLQKAFGEDQNAHQKLMQPQTAEEKQAARDFDTSIRNLLGSSWIHNYKQFAEQLREHGRVPLDMMVSLDKRDFSGGRFSNDIGKMAEHIVGATPDERARLLSESPKDADYRQKVFAGLNLEERKILLAVAKQNEVLPEDKLRAAVIQWRGSSEIAKAIKELDKDQEREDKEAAKANKKAADSTAKKSSESATEPAVATKQSIADAKLRYAEKYGHDLESDALNGTTDDDRNTALRILRKQLTTEEQAKAVHDEGWQMRDGAIARVADTISSTGRRLDESLDKLNSDLGKYHTASQQQAVQQEQLNDLKQTLETRTTLSEIAIDKHEESKATVVESVNDAALGVIAIGGVLTFGTFAIPAMPFLGAALKVGTNSYIYPKGNVVDNAIVGAAEGLGSALGPAEAASAVLVKLGTKTASEAIGESISKQAIKEALASSPRQAVNEAADSISNKVQRLVRDAISNNTDEIPRRQIKEIVANAVEALPINGDKLSFVDTLSQGISQSLQTQLKTQALENGAISEGLNIGVIIAAGEMQTVAENVTTGKKPLDSTASTALETIPYIFAFDYLPRGLGHGLGIFGGVEPAPVAHSTRRQLADLSDKDHLALNKEQAAAAKREELEESANKETPSGAIGTIAASLIPDPDDSSDADSDDDDDNDKTKSKKQKKDATKNDDLAKPKSKDADADADDEEDE